MKSKRTASAVRFVGLDKIDPKVLANFKASKVSQIRYPSIIPKSESKGVVS